MPEKINVVLIGSHETTTSFARMFTHPEYRNKIEITLQPYDIDTLARLRMLDSSNVDGYVVCADPATPDFEKTIEIFKIISDSGQKNTFFAIIQSNPEAVHNPLFISNTDRLWDTTWIDHPSTAILYMQCDEEKNNDIPQQFIRAIKDNSQASIDITQIPTPRSSLF